MPNEIQLDAAEFGDMVSQWEDGGKYRVELLITQLSNDGKTFRATVDEVTDYGDAEVVEEEVPAPAPKPKKPSAPKTETKY